MPENENLTVSEMLTILKELEDGGYGDFSVCVRYEYWLTHNVRVDVEHKEVNFSGNT